MTENKYTVSQRRQGSSIVFQYFKKLRCYCLKVAVELDATNSTFNRTPAVQTYLNDGRVLQASRGLWGLTHGEVFDVAASEDDVLKDFISRRNRPFSGPVLSSKGANCSERCKQAH